MELEIGWLGSPLPVSLVESALVQLFWDHHCLTCEKQLLRSDLEREIWSYCLLASFPQEKLFQSEEVSWLLELLLCCSAFRFNQLLPAKQNLLEVSWITLCVCVPVLHGARGILGRPGFSSESWPYIRDSQLHCPGLTIPSEHLSCGHDGQCQGCCGVAMKNCTWLTWKEEQKCCCCLAPCPALALLALEPPGHSEQPRVDVCSRNVALCCILASFCIPSCGILGRCISACWRMLPFWQRKPSLCIQVGFNVEHMCSLTSWINK